MYVAKGTFTASATTGDQSVTTTDGATGLTFQPKVVFLWGVRRNATGFGTGISAWFGCAVSSTQRWVVATAGDDGVTTSNEGRYGSTNAVLRILQDGNAATDGLADFVSMNTDGFTINWSDATALGYIIHYLALGGSAITNAKAGTFQVATTGATQQTTGVGFQPDFLLCAAINTSFGTGATTGNIMLGMASGPTAEGVASYRARDGQTTTNLVSYQDETQLIAPINAGSTSFGAVADLASFDTDGWTLNVTTLPGAALDVMYVALKGGSYKVGAETQRTATTGTKATTGVGFQPSGLLAFSWVWQDSGGSFDASRGRFAIAGADKGINQGGVWFQNADGVTTTDLDQATKTDAFLIFATQPSTLNAEADVSSLDSDGFTLDWTTVGDSTARQFIYAAFGTPESGGTTKTAAALIAGSSTVAAAVMRRRNVAPLVAGVSMTAVASTVRYRAVAPTVAGSSAVVATVGRRRNVAPLVAGVGTVTAVGRKVAKTAAAVIAGTSTVAALTAVRKVAAPTITGTGTVTAAPGARRTRSTLVAGQGAVTVSPGRTRSAAALIVGVGTVEALARRSPRTVAVLVAGVSTVTAATIRRRAAAALVAGASSVAVSGTGRYRAVTVNVDGVSAVAAVPSAPVIVLPTYIVPVYP